MEQDESVLAQRAATGEASAFEELVRLNRPKLLRFLVAYLGNHSDAEDLVQDTFARAYGALDRYDPTKSFTTWLFVIGRRLAANEKRRLARQRVRETEAVAEEEFEQTYAEVDGGTVWAAAKRILPEAAYTSLWLHYGEDQSVKEIAHIMDKTVTAVKVTLFRARRTLARELDSNLVKESISR